MDPVTSAPRFLSWLPALAVALAICAALAGTIFRADGDAPTPVRRALPFGLLFVAAVLALLSTGAEAAIDSRVGLREVSLASLAVVCGTPVVGWGFARMRWGAPGQRTFYQQIAANRTAAIVLLIVLVEVLGVTGFVVGGTIGVMVGSALAVGLIGGATAVVAGSFGALLGVRHGAEIVLDAVNAMAVMPDDGRYTVVRNVVDEVAIAADLPAPRLYVITDPAPNAFAIGTDARRAAIAVTSGLLDQLDREELQGVIAHEMAHIRNLDSRYGVLVAVFVGAVIVLATAFASFMTGWSIEADGISGLILSILVAIAAALFGLFVKTCATAAALAIQASVSREREFLADASSVAYTRNPAGLIRALGKLQGQPALTLKSPSTRHLWFVSPLEAGDAPTDGWRSTHPAIADRIARLRALGGQLDAVAEGSVAVRPIVPEEARAES
jgi:heat shock protein HtpX